MERATVSAGDDDVRRRALADELDASNLALNHYRLAPGAALPAGLHAHADQEEVFVVREGELTFSTYDPESGDAGTVTVAADEVVRFAPGEFQSGHNAGDEACTVLALGAPADSTDVRLPVACPDCGRGTVRFDLDPAGARFVCPDCGGERTPAPCPDCGDEDLRVAVRDDDAVVVCHDCGATFERPPVEED